MLQAAQLYDVVQALCSVAQAPNSGAQTRYWVHKHCILAAQGTVTVLCCTKLDYLNIRSTTGNSAPIL